jgi:phosphoribosylformimino-5-aminoimidazole carboxamide ribotide isomerase
MVMARTIEYFMARKARQMGRRMDLVPVIDLKGGVVVHARRGGRANYRPIETPLSPTSAPLDVTRGLMGLHPFRRLYIADLDAIAGTGDNRASVQEISRAFPALELWVDRGIAKPGDAGAWRALGLGPVVLGSESALDIATLRQALAASGDDAVLSLDFRGEDFQGPPEVLADATHWPRRVIAMTLARVGSGEGPDLQRLSQIKARAGGRSVYAAGGVRDARDLVALGRLGVVGALVATALHDGRLDPRTIAVA